MKNHYNGQDHLGMVTRNSKMYVYILLLNLFFSKLNNKIPLFAVEEIYSF